ncbi:PA14 domain-containing protein [Streptomyces sp. NPDC087787]|uniref:PA14 domain-containing protein n=1 Tax=Streptomyces sp. NPDC087787 TaxID=3365803 RepID=UPI0038129A8A
MNPARRTTTAAATAVVLATAGGLLTMATVPASAATTCTSPVFKRQFYANTKFSGTPKKTDCDSAVDESWSGAPVTGLPKDNFGVRWSVTRDFGSGGPFSFNASGLDGIRVHLDGVRKIDLWKDVSKTVSKSVNVTIPSGKHTLRVDYVNWTGSAKVKFTYAPRTAATVDKVKPLVPTGTSVSYDQATGKAKLTWVKNKEMDLAGYRIYRRGNGDSFPRQPLATTTSTSYTDTSLPKSGATFYYEFRAYDKAGNESTGTADQRVITVDRLAPTVRDLKVFGEDSLTWVTLGWMSDEGLLKYELLRSSSPDGPFTVVQSNLGNSATDETAPYGETSYYKVAATDLAGNTGYSSVVSFTRPLAVPYFNRSQNRPEDGGGVDLSWDVSPYAPTEFRVHREEHRFNEATGTFDVVDSRVVPCAPTLTDTAYGTRHTYACTDTTVTPSPSDSYYVYWVTTVDALGRESGPSATHLRSYRDSTAPPAVTGLTATATEYGTVLDWEDSPAADLAQYTVFRKSTKEDGTELTWVGRTEPGTTRFVDTENLQDGETLTYFVDAVDTSNNSIHTLAGDPYRTAHTTVTEHDLRPTAETPSGRLVSAEAKAGPAAGTVQLDWNPSPAYDPTDITGYRVYRWNRATAAYEPLTADPVTGLSYTDTTATVGTTHFYWVTALHADGTESAPGDAWAALAPQRSD